MYIGEMPVFFFENETGRSAEEFVSDVQDLVDRYTDTEDDDEEEDSEDSYDLPFVVIFAMDEGSGIDKAMGMHSERDIFRMMGFCIFRAN